MPHHKFDFGAFLATITDGVLALTYPQESTLFSQGTPAEALFYIENGIVKISVRPRRGREAVLAILGRGEFIGHECLAGPTHYISTATTIGACSLIRVERDTMVRLLAEHPAFSTSFLAYLLARNARQQEDLLDQLLHTSEQRLARALFLLARFDTHAQPEAVIPKINQQTLANLVGTTRSRINYFMNRFREKGLIEYNDGLHITRSLGSVMLHD